MSRDRPHLRGASDRARARQTLRRSPVTLNSYVRVQPAWTDNVATGLRSVATVGAPDALRK